MNDSWQVFIVSYLVLGVFFGIIAGLNSWAELVASGKSGWKPVAMGIAVGIGITFAWFPVAMIVGFRMLATK